MSNLSMSIFEWAEGNPMLFICILDLASFDLSSFSISSGNVIERISLASWFGTFGQFFGSWPGKFLLAIWNREYMVELNLY